MEDDMMNINEITRLIEWLEANGHTHAEAIECIQYINATQPPQKKEKPTATHPAKE
jgi:hypothetical protein